MALALFAHHLHHSFLRAALACLPRSLFSHLTHIKSLPPLAAKTPEHTHTALSLPHSLARARHLSTHYPPICCCNFGIENRQTTNNALIAVAKRGGPEDGGRRRRIGNAWRASIPAMTAFQNAPTTSGSPTTSEHYPHTGSTFFARRWHHTNAASSPGVRQQSAGGSREEDAKGKNRTSALTGLSRKIAVYTYTSI